MDRAFLSGASVSAPTPPASPSIGYATEGNSGTGTPATKPGPWWYHMMTEELRALVVAAGLTPSQSDLTQLLQALPGALASRPEMARSLASNGYQKLPGGLILQWGSIAFQSVPASNYLNVAVTFPIAFLTNVLTVSASPVVENISFASSGARGSTTTLNGAQITLMNSHTASQNIAATWFALGK